MFKHKIAIGIAAGFCAITLLFQNCTLSRLSSAQQLSSGSSGNGGSYDGIVYASRSVCSDSTPVSRIRFVSLASSHLLRDQCQDLVVPVKLAEGAVTFSITEPELLLFQGNPFVATTTPPISSLLSHGSELTYAMVGPAGLGVPINQLRNVAVGGERISTGGSGRPSWIPGTPYVYNNDPSNHGGIVPAGGMVIDGFLVPAGAWVSQFNNFDDSIILSGNNNGTSPDLPGIVFRGCRWRGPNSSPGFLNFYDNSNLKAFILFSESGGMNATIAQSNSEGFQVSDFSSSPVFYRNYISYSMAGIRSFTRSAHIVENFIEKISRFGGSSLVGISFYGSNENAAILRNKVLMQSPDESGLATDINGAIVFFRPFGDYLGAGTNIDGTRGYVVKDNLVGGGGSSIWAGAESGFPANSVRYMQLIGNKVTTQWFANGGFYGPITSEPSWGSFGNVKSNNTWADGLLAGQLF